MSEEESRKVAETALRDSNAWRAAGKWAGRTVGRFKTKRKIFIIVATAVFLASCGKEATSRLADAAISIGETAGLVEQLGPTVEEYRQYLDSVRKSSTEAESMDDSFLIGEGELICSYLDDGFSVDEIINGMAEVNNSDEDLKIAAHVLGSSIRYICPEYESDLEAWASDLDGDRTKPSTESSWTQKWVSVKYRSDPVDVGAPYFDSLDRSGSSVVRDAWFDQANQYLVINLNGTNYHYCGISEDVWLSMQVADSLDYYYISDIKGRFDCRINYLPSYG